MAARVGHGLDQLGHDMRRSRAVGVAHAQIDNILGGRARLGLGLIDLSKHIGRQTADTMEFFGHG